MPVSATVAYVSSPNALFGYAHTQRYVDHAICLKNTIQALRYNKKVLDLPDCDGGIDLIRCERINTLDEATRLRVPSPGTYDAFNAVVDVL
jgi:hypothetical protein